MKNKSLILVACMFLAVGALAATWTNNWTDGLFSGNGGVTTDIALPLWGANQNATVQISRNQTGDGGGQCSALDVYSSQTNIGCSQGGFVQRWWIDCNGVDGGKCVAMYFDYGGGLNMLGSILVSGVVKDHFSTGAAMEPMNPSPQDGAMIYTWTDEANGAGIVSAANGYSNDGDPAAQVYVAMDGHFVDAGIGEYHPNVRFAIDGVSGKLRWSNSIANNYRTATWDATFGRVAANILGDPSGVTNLQTLHLDQPATKNDVAGTISIVAAANGTHTFSTAYGAAPICTLTPTANPLGVSYWVTTTATTVKANLNAAATIIFNYTCIGNGS